MTMTRFPSGISKASSWHICIRCVIVAYESSTPDQKRPAMCYRSRARQDDDDKQKDKRNADKRCDGVVERTVREKRWPRVTCRCFVRINESRRTWPKRNSCERHAVIIVVVASPFSEQNIVWLVCRAACAFVLPFEQCHNLINVYSEYQPRC